MNCSDIFSARVEYPEARSSAASHSICRSFPAQASRLTAALRKSESQRINDAERRNRRVQNFRKLQDQLLHPPRLDGSRRRCVATDTSGGLQREDSPRDSSAATGSKSWDLLENPGQQDRALKTHALAATAACAGNKEVCVPCATIVVRDVSIRLKDDHA